jgi:hypothetical protein
MPHEGYGTEGAMLCNEPINLFQVRNGFRRIEELTGHEAWSFSFSCAAL